MKKKTPESSYSKNQLASVARFPDMNPGPVMETDHKGIISLSNVAARNILGKDPNGLNWLDLCPDIDTKTWQKILRARKAVALESRIGKKDYIFHHRHDKKSNLVFIYGADVTEQKQAEKKLRESDEMVRLLLNSTSEGIYGMDRDGLCIFANQTCLELLGNKKVEELLCKEMHTLIHHVVMTGNMLP